MNTKPYFSIVVPVYNKEPHISRSIDSVLKQNFQSYELIIINDASTDGSVDEIKKYSDPRIRLLHRSQPGPGGYAARNLGIKKAQAECVAFLDADDEWLPFHLENYIRLMEEFPNAAVLGCGWKIKDPDRPDSKIYVDPYYSKQNNNGNHQLTFKEYLQAEVSGLRPLWTSIACIKKKVLLDVNGFPAGKCKRGGDVDTWLRCIERAGGMVWSAHIGAVYYRDSVAMVTRTNKFLAKAERETVNKMLKKYNNGEIALLLKQFANRRTISAWKQNTKLVEASNFSLLGKLYMEVNTLKNIFWIVISILPKISYGVLQNVKQLIKREIKFCLLSLKRSFLADIIRLLRIWLLRLFSRPRNNSIVKDKLISNSFHLSDGNNATFFGYHDKTPFNADGTKILAMSVTANDASTDAECTPIKLGYFAKNDSGEFINDFISFAETNTWCWQQGCMLQWHPKNPECEVVFNRLVEGNYGSVVFNVDKGEMGRQYKTPIYSLDPKGRFATTLDFYRLGYLRPGYGYLSLPNENIRWDSPENDGLYILNLHTGEKNLLVSFDSLAADLMISGYKHYVNHATFSPDGDRLIFFHLWTNMQERRLRVLVTDPLTGRYNVLEAERIVSHYCWKDNNSILATTRDATGSWYYSCYDLNTGKRNDLDLPLNIDGHPMFHPHNKDIFVTDTYPDARREQHLYLANISDNKVTEIGSFFSPYKYRGQVRCDLHPRWDRDGKYIAVDSPNDGMRKISILEVDVI